MHNLAHKNSQTLTSSDIENLTLRFGGNSEDYIEIVNKQKNIETINKYALLKEINNELNSFVSSTTS
ncbi:BcsR/BcsP family cellulose biosynthesis protein [Pseudoalteromonas aliena]|uniref:BcsR/BcsP family cellulose biosynthesis protein n=1 Tax=Pseudoalteromonas aliena TaxID=247523 RepID=UPI00311DB498